jgi:uncharacterized protein (DUF1501 family)
MRMADSGIGRREFIRGVMFAGGGIILLGPHAWAARTLASGRSRDGKRLVVVFLRGAVDGLNVVVPIGEPAYYDYRPTIAVPRSGEGGALNLDGHFGLHPALAPLMAQWQDGTLAFVHACGSPDPTRSHFDAQDYMESGTPGVKSTSDGWMNRVLAQMSSDHPPTEAVSMGPTMPRILSGRMPASNIPLGRAAARPMPLDNPRIEQAFDRMYGGTDLLSRTYREGRLARRKLLADLEQDMRIADAGAPSPIGFPDDADRLARLMAHDPTIKLAFMALGGWDTHVNQGSDRGRLANHLKPLGEGLANFAKALGSSYEDTVILIISEFGRTARENGNAGTDHGHGNVMWVMGGSVRGRKVWGRWPGLASSELYQERDLAITTDFRDAVSTVLRDHLGLNESQLEQVFPGAPAPSANVSGLVRI